MNLPPASNETTPRASLIEADEFLQLIQATIPMARDFDFAFEALTFGHVCLRLRTGAEHTRAGGTLSGPTLMTLADTALYAAVLSTVGLEAMAVTSHLHFDFLRKPSTGELVAEARILKVGGRLVVGRVELYSGVDRAVDHARPVALCTGGYALPRPVAPPQ